MLRTVLRALREIAYQLKIWMPSIPQDIQNAADAFIAANVGYWENKVSSASVGILIEGHLSQYGPNYLLRTAVAANAIEAKTGLGSEVIYNGFSHQWLLSKRIYASFGIDKAIYLSNAFLIRNIAYFIKACISALLIAVRLRCPSDILKLRFGSLLVGDLIYDDILRNSRSKTVSTIGFQAVKALAISRYYFYQYKRLFVAKQYRYYIATHTAYSEYGLLCRLALNSGIRVIETTDIQMSLYDEISDSKLPTYHHGIHNSVKSNLASLGSNDDDQIRQAEISLRQRLDAQANQIDVQKAYKGRVYSRAEIEETLHLERGAKIFFILAHVFSDAPHLSPRMLHVDYYDWLRATLDICTRNPDVSWVVKPHPSSDIYGEAGQVERMVADLGCKHVVLCPADMNTKSLSVCADSIVTVHGTAGLEFACLGIPAILAGRPFYCGFGFTMEPASLEEYEKILLGAHGIAPLTTAQIGKALQVYYLWNEQFDWNNPIVTPEVLQGVWGEGSKVPRNLSKAYSAITENLRRTDPKKMKLWAYSQGTVTK